MVEFGNMGPQILEALNKLHKEIVANNFMLKRLLAKADINNQQLNSTGIKLDQEFISQFPVEHLDEFKLLETRIEHESEYVLKLVPIYTY